MIKILVIALLSTLIEAKELGIDLAWQLVHKRNDGLNAGQNSVKHFQVVKEGTETMMYMPSIDLHGSYTHLSEPINWTLVILLMPLEQLQLVKKIQHLA